MQNEKDGESELENEVVGSTIMSRKAPTKSVVTKLEIPVTVQQVISKIEQAQLLRARQDINMQLGDIMQNVQRTINRYTFDENIHPGRKISLTEHKKRRPYLLEKIAIYANSAEIREKTLVHILAWLEEWNAILSEMTVIDIDEHRHWIARMEILPETFRAIESNVNILSRISAYLLEEKKKQRKKTTSRGTLWKSWKERVIKRPATAHALRPDQMISDEFATNTKVSEIQSMLQELVGTAMFNKLENNAIKYISSTIANLSKALSTLNDEVKVINLQSANMYVSETSEREKELSLKIIEDLSEKNEMLQQKLQDAEEKCEQLIRSKVSIASPTSTLKILSELSPQTSTPISKADKEDSMDNILTKELETIVDEAQRKGTKDSGIKWDSAVLHTAQVETTPDLTEEQSPLPEKKQKTPSEDITEDKILLKKSDVHQKDGTDQYQSQKRKHKKVPRVHEISGSSLGGNEGKQIVSETKVDYHFEQKKMEKKNKEIKSFSEAKSKSSIESKGQHVPADFPSTDTNSQGGKSGARSTWEQPKMVKAEYLLKKSQISSEDKKEPTTESTGKESKSERDSQAEPFGSVQLDYSSEKLKARGKKHQSYSETTTNKELTGEDTSLFTKKFKSHERVKSKPRITKETSESTRSLGSSDDKSEQSNLEEFQKAIMAFLKEKTDNISKPLDKKTAPEKQLLLKKAEVENLEIIKAKMDEYFQNVAETVTKILRKYKDIKNAQQVGEKAMKQKKVVSFKPELHFQKPISAMSEINTLLSNESMDPAIRNLIEMILTEIESERDAPVISVAERDHKEKEKQKQKEYLQEGQEKIFDMNLKHHLQEEKNLWKKRHEIINKNMEKENAWLQMEGKQEQKQNQWQDEEIRKEQQKQRMQKQIEQDEKQKRMEEEEEQQKQKEQQLKAQGQKVKEQERPLEKGQQMGQVQKEVKHLEPESSQKKKKKKPMSNVEDHEGWQKKAKDRMKIKEENSKDLKKIFSHASVTLSPRWKNIWNDVSQLHKRKEFQVNLETKEILSDEKHPIPITSPTSTQSSLPGPFPILEQSPTKSITVIPEKTKALKITPTSEQAQKLGRLFTPEQAQALGIPILSEQTKELGIHFTPKQAQALDITLTPHQAQSQGITLTPQQAQAQGITITPEQAKAQGITVTPQKAQTLEITLPPQQVQAHGITLTSQQAQALGITLTPQQAQAQGITLTPEQAQTLGITLIPQQAQTQEITLTPEQAQTQEITLTPEQAQAQGITLTPEQVQIRGITLTPEQAQAEEITLTPQQAQAQGITLTPEQVQTRGITLTSQQAQAQGITLTPEQAQARGITLTPQQVQAQEITLTPQQAQARGITLTPEQVQEQGITLTPHWAQAQGITLTPHRAQAQGITLTPHQAQAQEITLTPQQAQALGIILTPQQAQAQGITLTPHQVQTQGITLTPQQAQAQEITLTPQQAQAQEITLTPQQAQTLGITLTPQQAQAQGITLTPHQVQTQGITLTPHQAQAMGITLTPQQAQAQEITLTPEQAQTLGITLTPQQAQAQGITLTPQQAQAQGITLTPQQIQTQGITLTPEQAQAQRITLTPEQAQTLGIILTPQQAQAQGITLTPQQAQALGVTLIPPQAHAQGVTHTPQEAQALGISLTPQQAQAQRIILTPQQPQALGIPITPPNMWVSAVTLTPKQTQALGVPLTSDKTHALGSLLTPEQVQPSLRPFQESKASLPSGQRITSITRQSLVSSAPMAEKSSIFEVSSIPLQISRSPLTQALFVPEKSLGMGIPSDSRKLLAPQTFPSSSQTLVSKTQSTSVQVPAPEVPPTTGTLPISGAPLTLGQPLISAVTPTSSRIPSLWDPLSPRKPLVPGVPSIPEELIESGHLTLSEQPQAFQPPATCEQSPYLQAPSTVGQHLAPWTLPEQAFPLCIPSTSGHPPTLWAPSAPGKPQKDFSSSVSKRSKERLAIISSLKSKAALVHPSAPDFKIPQAPSTTKKFQISEISDTSEEIQILSNPFVTEQSRTFQSYLTNDRTPVLQTPYIDEGALPTLMKPITSLPSPTTKLPKTSQISPSEWDQKSRFPPINKPCILTSVSGTKKPKMMVPPSSPQELKEQRYFVDVEAQRRNLILLNQATKTSGLPSELHAAAKNLIIETLHTDTVRLGYLFHKYIAYRLIQRARNNIIKRLQAIQYSGKGYETQNLYIMLSRIDDYQKKVMGVWTKKQKSLEQERNQCLKKMIFLFRQLQEMHKLNLSQPIPLIINKNQISAPTKFAQQPFLELLIEEDRKPEKFKKFRQEDQMEAIWNADQSTSSYPIEEKTSINSLWAKLGGYPAIPMLLQLDVQSTFRKSLASIQSQ
ncbi:protein FAM186A [Pteropus vampyrus]|uniref:Protein FAM186A n=1 Tax=Pteropus vampyrus TaxID=132908 RepID=A0A6P3QL39_PTEVA|nr:protein FAM186A [Pteropus vampyrus]